jgi:hypothetical protein
MLKLPNAQSHRNPTTHQVLKNAEQEKKRAYNDRIIEVENGTFTPMVFGTNGAMGDECKKFHKELAHKLSNKRSENKAGFPLDGILRAERNFSLSCDFSGGTN